eukprot:Nitzschia sp. Nitz4//scaffold128_size63911//17080//19513//NITZ4_006215-RA/size63911-snap-gene-0.66-mRNA-1//-1//CDS//3329534820//2736//frame0
MDQYVEVADVLLELLDLMSVWTDTSKETQANSTWDNLSSRTSILALSVQRLEKLSDSTSLQKSLLQIEYDLEEVWNLVSLLRIQIPKDAANALEKCQQMLHLVEENEVQDLYPLVTSLMSAIRLWVLDTVKLLQHLEYLGSRIYLEFGMASSSHDGLSHQFQTVSEKLKNRCLLSDRSPWSDAKNFVRSFGSEVKGEGTVSDFPLVTSLASVSGGRFTSSRLGKAASSAIEAAMNFANTPIEAKTSPQCILLTGPEGSGKTHCCNEIESTMPSQVVVLRPSLPNQILATRVGQAEDSLIAMINYAKSSENRSLLILDNIDSVCSFHSAPQHGKATNETQSNRELHVTARLRALFLTLIDMVHQTPGSPMMLLCTSRENIGKQLGRFDQTFTLQLPNAQDRKLLIRSCLLQCKANDDGGTMRSDEVDCLAVNTSGLSVAELGLHCRQAFVASIENGVPDDASFLQALKVQLQQVPPEALKSGVNSDFVDMQVLTNRDLVEKHSGSKELELPLYGRVVEDAWGELQRLIVTPLCQTKELHNILFNGASNSGKKFAGGVMLTGPPGTGKTSLAYHCAAVASSLNPAIKLLDVSCTSLIHKEVGASEKAIHKLFQTARSAAPCILLLDGIENVAAVRGNDNTTEGTMDRVLSTLLTELDGVESGTYSADDPACLSIIAITPNPSWVDPALRRPGRLERIIRLEGLEWDARKRIAERELEGIASSDLGLPDFVANHTEGFSGASVVASINEAKFRTCAENIHNDDNALEVTMPTMHKAIISQKAGMSVMGTKLN